MNSRTAYLLKEASSELLRKLNFVTRQCCTTQVFRQFLLTTSGPYYHQGAPGLLKKRNLGAEVYEVWLEPYK